MIFLWGFKNIRENFSLDILFSPILQLGKVRPYKTNQLPTLIIVTMSGGKSNYMHISNVPRPFDLCDCPLLINSQFSYGRQLSRMNIARYYASISI